MALLTTPRRPVVHPTGTSFRDSPKDHLTVAVRSLFLLLLTHRNVRGMMAKDINRIREAPVAQGWEIKAGGKYDYAYPPDKSKRRVKLPSTPGGGRWMQNLIAELRRSGFIWEGR